MSQSEKLAYSSLWPGASVHLAVAPGVLAVVVGHDVGEEERVVERGVEGVLLGRRAAGGVDAAQQDVPLAVAWAATWVSDQPGSSAARLARRRAVLTKEMATFIEDVGRVGRVGVEGDVGAADGAGAGAGVRRSTPGTGPGPGGR